MLQAAVISVCLLTAPNACEEHHLRVEARACSIPPLKAEVELNGTWVPARARILCEGHK